MSGQPTARTARGTSEMAKYMNSLNEYPSLRNLVEYLNRDLSSLPEWEQKFLSETKLTLQYRLRDHFESCAKTRSLFASMAADIWKEKESHLFNLTEVPRPILGYLPKYELQRLNEMTAQAVLVPIHQCQAKLDDILDKIRASESDREEISCLMQSGVYLIEELEDYQSTLQTWEPIAEKKIAYMKELEEREKFLKEVDDFELHAIDPSRFNKNKNSLNFAKENKFRSTALKKIEEMDKRAAEILSNFKKETGREFEIDGINYAAHMKEEMADRSTMPNLSLIRLSLEKPLHNEGPHATKNHYLLYTGDDHKEHHAAQTTEESHAAVQGH